MNIQLFRIDDRLIHGQVVLGWANSLNSHEILLCDDAVFGNEWERQLYSTCVPDYLSVKILDQKSTAACLKDINCDFSKTIVLTASPFVVENLLEMGCPLDKVNVGGIHFREGRKGFLPYLYLDADEIASFKRSMIRSVTFECQDVPTGQKINLKNLIG